MVKTTSGPQLADGAEQHPVGISRRSHYELNGHACGATRMQRVSWLAIRLGFALHHDQLPNPLEVVQCGGEALLRRDLRQARTTGCFEVEGDSAGQRRQSIDLRSLATGEQLHVDVSRDPVPLPV